MCLKVYSKFITQTNYVQEASLVYLKKMSLDLYVFRHVMWAMIVSSWRYKDLDLASCSVHIFEHFQKILMHAHGSSCYSRLTVANSSVVKRANFTLLLTCREYLK